MELKYEKFINGQEVRLDKLFRNSSIVQVVRQSPNRMFTTVKLRSDGAEWDVMTRRLTKI